MAIQTSLGTIKNQQVSKNTFMYKHQESPSKMFFSLRFEETSTSNQLPTSYLPTLQGDLCESCFGLHFCHGRLLCSLANFGKVVGVLKMVESQNSSEVVQSEVLLTFFPGTRFSLIFLICFAQLRNTASVCLQEKLMALPKEPFKMSCGDQLCVHLAHISLATAWEVRVLNRFTFSEVFSKKHLRNLEDLNMLLNYAKFYFDHDLCLCVSSLFLSMFDLERYAN